MSAQTCKQLNKIYTNIKSSLQKKEKETIKDHSLVLINDYTKNISEGVFSPGDVGKGAKKTYSTLKSSKPR